MSWGYDLMQDVHRGRWWEWATRYTLERSAFFISDAQATRDKAVHYGMDPTRTVIFPWGIDLQHFSPKKAYGPAEQTFMLFCNRSWEPLYGVDVVARAFIKVAQQRPEASLTLLGSGSQAGLLRQILLSGDVMDRVYFGGKVAQADLPGWYHQADLYLSASHVDGSSVSLMEAMACGLPSVVSDIPGNREWVVNHHNGWLFRDGDADALAARILHAMDKRADLAEVGRRARQVAEQRADWDKNSLTLLNTYETIASQAAQKPGGSGLRKPQPE
jgi:glycosyltransferase involved in cell wall biosynthesis